MAVDWKEFNKKTDLEALKSDEKDAQENVREFKEVPEGQYEVKVTKLELGLSKNKAPMLTIWFDILTGEFEKQKIFYNQVVDNGYGLHNANDFLRSLESDMVIEFKDYDQYNNLILDVKECIDGNEYGLKYEKTNKGYSKFTILEKFESKAQETPKTEKTKNSDTEDEEMPF